QEYAKAQAKLLAVLKTFEVPMFKSGERLASQFASGLNQGIAAVVAAARKLADALEGISSSLGSKSGGKAASPAHRAMGGPIAAGRAYIVGERGPEMFVSGSNGNILPNVSAGGVSLYFNVQPGGTLDRQAVRDLVPVL